jgi:hypothetical protein
MRNYGRFTTSIYKDNDFRALTVAEQGVYFMLGLQAEVTAAGTLPLTLQRWARMSADFDRDELAETLSVLDQRGHIVVDWDTEELLIVKFVKWDGGVGNEKRRPVIREAACAIESKRIRHRLAYELTRLGYADMASEVSEDGVADAQSGFDRVVVTEDELDPATPEPHPATPAPVAGTELAPLAATSAQTIIAAWIDWAPKRPPQTVIGHVAKHVGQMLAEGIAPDDIRRGLAAWTSKGLHPSTLPSVVNEVMNAGGKSRAQDETDAMFARAARRLGVAQ